MNHTTRSILALGMLAAAHAAVAQTPPVPAVPPVPPVPMIREEVHITTGPQRDRERVIQGAPYCADAVHESVQPLADGNRIVHRQSSRQCRDGQGRTRQETGSGKSHIYLRDPVAKESWMLDSETKTAVRIGGARVTMGHSMPDPGMAERLRGWSREFRDRLFSRAEAPAEPGGATERQHIVIREVRRGDAAGPPPLPMPPIAFHARFPGPRGPGATNLLPAETIEGLKADGSRTTWTVEAGRIGNEKPMQIVSEVWTSPELGITVRSRELDPLVGETTFRLQNVVRGEPDAQLFRVPGDYRKVEPKAMPLPPMPPVAPVAPVPPVPRP